MVRDQTSASCQSEYVGQHGPGQAPAQESTWLLSCLWAHQFPLPASHAVDAPTQLSTI